METKLDALQFKVGNPFVAENDVHVDFEYEKLLEHEVKFYLNAYVGLDDDDYRFCLKLIYILDFHGINYQSDNEMVEMAIERIIPSFTELVLILDSLVKEDMRERH